MKKLRCDEAGFSECNWEFLGETEEEVLRKAHEHGRQMHNTEVEDVKLRPRIRNA